MHPTPSSPSTPRSTPPPPASSRRSSPGGATSTRTPSAATGSCAPPRSSPSTCARSASRSCGRRWRTPGWSACSRAASPVRRWRCAPTWTRFRSAKRSTSRSRAPCARTVTASTPPCCTPPAMPVRGVDPIVVASQVVMGLQTIVSRQMNITHEPSVVTVGVFHGGVRHNIIPDEVKLEGTIRAFDEQQRDEIHRHVKRVSEMIAEAGGAKARVHIHRWYDVTVNHPELTAWSIPTLNRMAGDDQVGVVDKVCGAEDFSFYQQQVPGFFYFVGCTPSDKDAATAAPNHSPRFYVDEKCLKLGVKTLSALALDWLAANARK